MKPSDHPNVIVFDGVCNLCNGLVQFVIKRDLEKRFRFAAMQSDAGKAILAQHGFDPDAMDAVLVVVDGNPYAGADGVLALVRAIGGIWKVTLIFGILPRFMRNLLYGAVAKIRYRLFGKRDSCMVPSKDVTERFL